MIFYDKILLKIPVLFEAIIDDFVDDKKYKDRTDFINKAIEEKLKKEYGRLEPQQHLELDDCFYK